MAPSRAGSPPMLSMSMQGAHQPLPLPRRLIRQIQRRVADSGRQLRRLEVGGHVLDNFDTLDAGSGDSSSDESPSPPHLYPPPLRQPCAPVQPQHHFRPQPNVADRIASPETTNGDHDDDLTSLSWLQDRNLLSGINLSKDGDDLRPLSMDLSQPSLEAVVPASPCNTPPPSTARLAPAPVPPAPPAPHPNPNPTKPPYSFSCLIFMAIEASSARALPVKDIYAWIIKHFPYFRNAPQGWKNSVRHNLSLNKCFHKVNKGGSTNGVSGSIGKGSLWTVDPVHRPALLQAFTRAPPPHHLTTSPPLLTTQLSSPPASPPPASPPHNHLPSKGAPDPQLFPFLAKRLAAGPDGRNSTETSLHNSNGHGVGGPDVMDEYDAAAIVLQLKHGPGVLLTLPNRNYNRSDYISDREELITSSPSQDHAYIAGDSIDCPEAKVECILGSTSPVHNFNNNHQPIKYTAAIYQRGLDEKTEFKKEPLWHRSSLEKSLAPLGEEEERNTAEVLLSLANGNNCYYGPVRSRTRRRRPPPR